MLAQEIDGVVGAALPESEAGGELRIALGGDAAGAGAVLRGQFRRDNRADRTTRWDPNREQGGSVPK